MTNIENNSHGGYSERGWHVLAASADLALRHVFHARLGVYNLALWRSDDGTVNAWENRCPHRSVPLTMGINLGNELRCQYHGWRFSSGSGECTTVPAQPGDPANRAACVSTFDCVEQDGWVWVALRKPDAFSLPPLQTTQVHIPLRAVTVHVSKHLVLSAFEVEWGKSSAEAQGVQRIALADGELRFFLQAQSVDSCIVHAQWLPMVKMDATSALALQRKFNERFTVLRDRLESALKASRSLVLPDPIAIPMHLSERRRQQSVKVMRRTQTATDICAFELVSADGHALHGFDAGAHIEVQTPSGLLRHYSLVNAPHERESYVIGIKREENARGGSKELCDVVGEGATLQVGLPVNRFTLRPTGASVLIAGGIGITPVLAMAQQLAQDKRDYVLHYFVRAQDHVAFAERIKALGDKVQLHLGLDADATKQKTAEILKVRAEESHLYVCGPAVMIEMVVDTAQAAGWPDNSVHREYFGNNQLAVREGDTAFEVVLQRSGKTITVPVGRSIASVAREIGVMTSTVCEQGACGTCETVVLAGEPDHRDVYLSPAERASGRCTMVCVSRAKSATLVLDL